MTRALFSFLIAALLVIPVAYADKAQENLFATVYLKDDKIGKVHLTTIRDENGELEEFKANASVSFLGLEVYGFTQNLHEHWTKGDLQSMEGQTDDNGTPHNVDLNRGAAQYDGKYNEKPITLPLDAFPTTPWHYDITQSKLLFNIVDFDLLKVEIKESPDTIEIGDKKIETTKYVFTGDWEAVLWFDDTKNFVKGEYDISGRQITVILD